MGPLGYPVVHRTGPIDCPQGRTHRGSGWALAHPKPGPPGTPPGHPVRSMPDRRSKFLISIVRLPTQFLAAGDLRLRVWRSGDLAVSDSGEPATGTPNTPGAQAPRRHALSRCPPDAPSLAASQLCSFSRSTFLQRPRGKAQPNGIYLASCKLQRHRILQAATCNAHGLPHTGAHYAETSRPSALLLIFILLIIDSLPLFL